MNKLKTLQIYTEQKAEAMSLHVEKVWLRGSDGQEVLSDIRGVKPGDIVVVRTGDMIPLDGTVSARRVRLRRRSALTNIMRRRCRRTRRPLSKGNMLPAGRSS